MYEDGERVTVKTLQEQVSIRICCRKCCRHQPGIEQHAHDREGGEAMKTFQCLHETQLISHFFTIKKSRISLTGDKLNVVTTRNPSSFPSI